MLFFDSIELTAISSTARSMLDAPNTLEEPQKTLSGLPNTKAPHIDGLPGKIYKKYGDILIPELLAVVNDAYDYGTLPPSMNEGVILLFLKPEKKNLHQNFIDQFLF